MPPKITVFMAAYNVAEYISDSIESVLNQSFEDFELLIVNDGSTDNTVEIINQFTDPRIRLVHNDKNRGLTYTRNVAVKEARGAYIAILDSDDIALDNRLELQYDFFQKHPDVALCGGQGIIIDSNGKLTREKLTVPAGIDQLKMLLLFNNTYINSSVMYKTAVLIELNGYEDYAPAEDYELFVRIAEKYPIANLQETLVQYRVHEHNTSTLKFEQAKTNIRKIKKNQLAYLQISNNGNMADTLFSILMWDYKSFKLADYLHLFSALKSANRHLKKFPVAEFEKLLFDKWFETIYIKKAKMNALPLLLHKSLFKWSFLESRQLRKAFKLSLKGFGKLSK